jgi:hypothetical protein
LKIIIVIAFNVFDLCILEHILILPKYGLTIMTLHAIEKLELSYPMVDMLQYDCSRYNGYRGSGSFSLKMCYMNSKFWDNNLTHISLFIHSTNLRHEKILRKKNCCVFVRYNDVWITFYFSLNDFDSCKTKNGWNWISQITKLQAYTSTVARAVHEIIFFLNIIWLFWFKILR